MIRINELKLPLDEDEKELYRLAAKALKIGERHIRELTICKKSVDCRKKTILNSSSASMWLLILTKRGWLQKQATRFR